MYNSRSLQQQPPRTPLPTPTVSVVTDGDSLFEQLLNRAGPGQDIDFDTVIKALDVYPNGGESAEEGIFPTGVDIDQDRLTSDDGADFEFLPRDDDSIFGAAPPPPPPSSSYYGAPPHPARSMVESESGVEYPLPQPTSQPLLRARSAEKRLSPPSSRDDPDAASLYHALLHADNVDGVLAQHEEMTYLSRLEQLEERRRQASQPGYSYSYRSRSEGGLMAPPPEPVEIYNGSGSAAYHRDPTNLAMPPPTSGSGYFRAEGSDRPPLAPFARSNSRTSPAPSGADAGLLRQDRSVAVGQRGNNNSGPNNRPGSRIPLVAPLPSPTEADTVTDEGDALTQSSRTASVAMSSVPLPRADSRPLLRSQSLRGDANRNGADPREPVEDSQPEQPRTAPPPPPAPLTPLNSGGLSSPVKVAIYVPPRETNTPPLLAEYEMESAVHLCVAEEYEGTQWIDGPNKKEQQGKASSKGAGGKGQKGDSDNDEDDDEYSSEYSYSYSSSYSEDSDQASESEDQPRPKAAPKPSAPGKGAAGKSGVTFAKSGGRPPLAGAGAAPSKGPSKAPSPALPPPKVGNQQKSMMKPLGGGTKGAAPAPAQTQGKGPGTPRGGAAPAPQGKRAPSPASKQGQGKPPTASGTQSKGRGSSPSGGAGKTSPSKADKGKSAKPFAAAVAPGPTTPSSSGTPSRPLFVSPMPNRRDPDTPTPADVIDGERFKAMLRADGQSASSQGGEPRAQGGATPAPSKPTPTTPAEPAAAVTSIQPRSHQPDPLTATTPSASPAPSSQQDAAARATPTPIHSQPLPATANTSGVPIAGMPAPPSSRPTPANSQGGGESRSLTAADESTAGAKPHVSPSRAVTIIIPEAEPKERIRCFC